MEQALGKVLKLVKMLVQSMEYFGVGAEWNDHWGLCTGFMDGFRPFRGCFKGGGGRIM